MRKPILWLSFVGLAAAVACADLPTIAANQCGNHVLESNEDCDSFPSSPEGGAGTCIAPSQTGQCHYACDPSATTPGCPPPFFCGADNICRRPSGQFESPLAVTGEPTKTVLVGDFDGDHASDVVAVGTTATRIYFFDGRTQPVPIRLASTSTIPPALGRLASDDRTSAVVVTPILSNGPISSSLLGGGSLRVWRGSAQRTLLPTIYPSIDLTTNGFKDGVLVPVLVAGSAGSDLMALASGGNLGAGEYGIFNVASSQSFAQPQLLFVGLAAPSGIRGQVPVGVLGDGSVDNAVSACQVIVLAYVGASSVGVYPTCTNAPGHPVNYAGDPNHLGPAFLDLSKFGTVSGRSFLVRAPGKIAPDLFVAMTGGLVEVTGTSTGLPFGTAALIPTPPGTSAKDILAVGYINNDSAPDWVDASGIHVNGINFATPLLGGTSIDARIADFNGNGLNDVVSLSATGLDYYNGSGIGFENGLHIPVDGTAQKLAIGDFDGDFLTDFALTTSPDPSSTTTNLLVAFGNFTSFPDPPLSIGQLDSVQQIAPAFFDYRISGAPDFISTLFAIGIAANQDLVVSTLQGSPDRLINSPFFLDPGKGFINLATVGDFATPGQPALAGLAVLPGPLTTSVRLWSVPATGDAQLDATKVVEAQSAVGIDPIQVSGAALVALDVGGAPGDELVGVAPNGPGPAAKADFVVAALGDKDWLPLDFENFTGYPIRDGGTVGLYARDVDGDGNADILLLYRDAPNGSLVAKVIFNDMSGSLRFDSAVKIELPAGTVGVTTIHASPDGSTSLAAVTNQGVFLAPVTGRSVGAFVPVAGMPAPQPFDITAGDADGDGVDDLIVGASSGFLVYFGIPAVRK